MSARLREAMLNGQNWPAGMSPLEDRVAWADRYIRSVLGAYGCELWLDARDIVTIADGADITTWPARVGTSPTQPTSSKRPEFSADGWSGGPCVLFDNVGEALPCTVDLSSTPAVTLLVAARSDASSAAASAFEYNTNWLFAGGFQLYFNSQNLYASAAPNLVAARREDADGVSARNVVGGCVFDGATTPDYAGLWKADAPSVAKVTNLSVDVDSSEATTNYPAASAWIGSRNDGASLPLDGAVRELLLIPARVPDETMLLLMHALSLKAEIA
jgi:hypothetical protein